MVERWLRGEVTQEEAARALGLSPRQVRRLGRRLEVEGQLPLEHGNRGRRSAQRSDEAVRSRVLKLRRDKYEGFNDTHFTEKLAKDGVELSRGTVRRILREAGIGSPRKRRARKHHKRRDRKEQAGLMIVWDGSRHDWLEGRGPHLCLMGAVDDATSELLPGAHFVEQECAAGYLRVLMAIALEKGLPHAAYGDRHGALKRNDGQWTLEEELRGEQDPTQVGRALRALDVTNIHALSPQAKGRVERLWGSLQDRLCSELRLAGARTLQEANGVLERYRHEHNERFAVAAKSAASAWRKVPRACDLARHCSFFYEATVRNDNTVHIGGNVIDIPPGPGGRGYAHARVEVRQLIGGSWRVYYQDRIIATQAGAELHELRAAHRRKRSAASMAFRKAVTNIDELARHAARMARALQQSRPQAARRARTG